MTAEEAIDTSNDQLVGIRGGQVVTVLFPRNSMTKAEALRHAAWLVALADDRDEFPAILAAVKGT